jgi:arabinose-5-phosphate isomerase
MLNINQKESILVSARNTLLTEIEALKTLHDSLGQEFCSAVEVIYSCRGRLVVTGIGKSALIAQKLVSTFNSTGTPALFMHAADAVHGDLGMIQQEDILLCLSKSGGTAELKVLVPLVKRRGNKILAIVANRMSWLFQNADVSLLLPYVMEAEPNNLAPTASTAAQLAMGDALAVSLLALRGFSPDHFAELHPGGALGKQLYMKVRDLIAHNERPIVQEDTPMTLAILEMTSKRLGCTVVEKKYGNGLGIITDGDLRRMLKKEGPGFVGLTAGDVMSSSAKTIDVEELAVNALLLMKTYSITQLIALDSGEYAGIVHLHNLIREGLV